MKTALAVALLSFSSLASAFSPVACSEYVKLVLIYQQWQELGVPFREALSDARKDVEKFVSKPDRPRVHSLVQQGIEDAYTIKDPALLSVVARARCQTSGN